MYTSVSLYGTYASQNQSILLCTYSFIFKQSKWHSWMKMWKDSQDGSLPFSQLKSDW